MSLISNLSDPSVLLVPQDVKGLIYQGYLILKDEEFPINVTLKSKDSLKDARFDCDWKMRELLKGYEDVLKKKLSQSSTLMEFLIELKTLLENLLSFENQQTVCTDTSLLQNLFKDIKSIGWDKFIHTNDDFTCLKFMYRDVANREHFLCIENKEGMSNNKVQTDLPMSIVQKKGDSLGVLYQKFIKIVDNCQLFWNVLKYVDEKCWVLEPEATTYGCTYRRLAIGKNASIRIDVNPIQPKTFPECRFLGPSQVIDPLKENLNKNLMYWNDTDDLLQNLEKMLDISFPSKSSLSKEEVRMDCGICYSYRLEDKIPEKSCEDVRCGQIFHVSCLVEWIRSLPSCRQSFNVIFGECPYCNKKLTINLKP